MCIRDSVEAVGPEVAPRSTVAGPAQGLWGGLVQRAPSDGVGDSRPRPRPASEISRGGWDLKLWEPKAS
eukprot:9812189-Alexandrium_andersonii.AAC.1